MSSDNSVFVVENDGHNCVRIHRFNDTAHMLGYVTRGMSDEEREECVSALTLDDEGYCGEFTDESQVMWTLIESPESLVEDHG